MDQAGRQARTLRRHEESEAEIDRVRKEQNKQLTFRPDIHAQQAALRGNNNSTVAKSQKMLRRRQKAAAAAMREWARATLASAMIHETRRRAGLHGGAQD